MRTLEETHLVLHERNKKANTFYSTTDKAEADDVCRKECEANASEIASGDLRVYVLSVPSEASKFTLKDAMESLGFGHLYKNYISNKKDSSI